MPKIFLNYRRDDSDAMTHRIFERLCKDFDKESIIMDVDSIPLGVDFPTFLDESLRECDLFLTIIGTQWLDIIKRRSSETNDFVRIEVESALNRSIHVIPVLIGKATMPDEKDLPDTLKLLHRRHGTSVDTGRNFYLHMELLIREMKKLLKPKPTPSLFTRFYAWMTASNKSTSVDATGPRIAEVPKISSQPDAPREISAHVAPIKPSPPETATVITNSIGMKLVRIEAGKVLMGSPESELGRSNDECQHEVEITRPFYLGKYAVTLGEFRQFATAARFKLGDIQAYIRDNPDTHPVAGMYWKDAKEFCHWLSKKEGKRYRLPTEAEWEYACRAGTTTPFSFGGALSKSDANYNGKGTVAIGNFSANQWGLCEMHGNVWEWCEDWYEKYDLTQLKNPSGPTSGSLRVARGGSWDCDTRNCRSAYRGDCIPSLRSDNRGFRVVLEVH